MAVRGIAIHVILTPEQGIAEIPLLLQGKSLEKSDNVGTQNYTQPPVAVVTGGAYDDESVSKMREACKDDSVRKVPWLRPDLSVSMPPLGPEYGKAMVARIKVAMKKLEDEGKMKGDGIHFM